MSEQSFLLFNAGGLALAVDSASVHCIHDGLSIQSEDDTINWFSGLAVADDRLLPVTDLGLYLNGSASLGRIIEVARHLGVVGFKIDEVRGVSKKRPVPINSDQTEVEVDSSLKSVSVNDFGRHFQLIDVAGLLQSNRFLNVHNEPA